MSEALKQVKQILADIKDRSNPGVLRGYEPKRLEDQSGSIFVFESTDRKTGDVKSRELGPYCFDCLADAFEHYMKPAKVKPRKHDVT